MYGGESRTCRSLTQGDTRSRILANALQLIADKGFAATSTRELSERLGFTKAALYYHFRTKDDLLSALIDPVLADLADLVAPGGRRSAPAGNAARRDLLAGYIALVGRHEELIRVLSHDPAVTRQPALEIARSHYEELTVLLMPHVGSGTADRVRVRSALGGIHAALLHPKPGEDQEIVRRAALAAACGALGHSCATVPRISGGGCADEQQQQRLGPGTTLRCVNG